MTITATDAFFSFNLSGKLPACYYSCRDTAFTTMRDRLNIQIPLSHIVWIHFFKGITSKQYLFIRRITYFHAFLLAMYFKWFIGKQPISQKERINNEFFASQLRIKVSACVHSLVCLIDLLLLFIHLFCDMRLPLLINHRPLNSPTAMAFDRFDTFDR